MSFLRAFLLLVRGTGLPIIWAHTLAGWWLGGGGRLEPLGFLFPGVTLLYLGGAFTNDVFDAPYDREYRPARPIPSGVMTTQTVWRWGCTWLALGVGCLFCLGIKTGALALLLTAWILTYNTTHRIITLSPVMLGVCHLLLYLVGASCGYNGITGWSIWCGIAVAIYFIGSQFLNTARNSSSSEKVLAATLLGAPVFLALVMNANAYRQGALLLCTILGLWVVRSLRPLFWRGDGPAEASGLFAGMVLVDWLAVADAPRSLSAIFIGLFLLAVVFQKIAASAAAAHAPLISR